MGAVQTIREWTPKLARDLRVIGLINIQYCVQDNQVPPPSITPVLLIPLQSGALLVRPVVCRVKMMQAH